MFVATLSTVEVAGQQPRRKIKATQALTGNPSASITGAPTRSAPDVFGEDALVTSVPALSGGPIVTVEALAATNELSAQVFQLAVLKHQQELQQTMFAFRKRLNDLKHEAYLLATKNHGAFAASA